MKYTAILILLAMSAVILAAGSQNQPQKVEPSPNKRLRVLDRKNCDVIYRRDALGITASKGLGPEVMQASDTPNLYAQGRFLGITDGCILLETQKDVKLIPITSVLQVRFNSEVKKELNGF